MAFLIRLRNAAINECRAIVNKAGAMRDRRGVRHNGRPLFPSESSNCRCEYEFGSEDEYLQPNSQQIRARQPSAVFIMAYPKCTPHSTLRCSDHWRAFSLLWSPSGECREYFWISKPAEGWADMRGVATFGGGCSAQANLYVTQFMYLQNMRCHYPDLGVYIKRDTVNSPTSQAGKVLQLEKKTLMELVL